MRAARVVFGRDGYARASIDAIAREAGVSTRTIYNHFAGKEELFSTVLEASATQVADAFIARVQALPLSDLEGLGEALVSQALEFPEHFAMVRQITAEGGHFPAAVLDRWRQAGPLRVESEVADRLAALAAEGALRAVADPRRAAVHFIALTASPITISTHFGARPLAAATRTEIIASGVEAFLNGYAAAR